MVTLVVISSPGNSPRPSNFRNQISNKHSLFLSNSCLSICLIKDFLTLSKLIMKNLGSNDLKKFFRNCHFQSLLLHSTRFFSNQVQFLAGLIPVQLEDRIVNPDLRDHSLLGPILNPEIMTGRAPYWASGAKSSSKVLFLIKSRYGSAKSYLEFFLTLF